MPDELEERLRSHAKSFDSLLSLIPAKLYYGEDVSDQWKRTKQTPEQKRAAKMAKLDPDNWKSAKDVMDERSAAAKRKRDDDDGGSDSEPLVEPEPPKAIQDEQLPKSKKRKVDQTDGGKQTAQEAVSEKRKEKLQKLAEKKSAKKDKKKQKDAQKPKQDNAIKDTSKQHDESWVDVDEDDNEPAEAIGADQIPLSNLEDVEMADDASTATSSNLVSPIMSPVADSASSSISSIPASISDQPTTFSNTKASKKSKSKPEASKSLPLSADAPPVLDASAKAAARARLADAITSMRTQRKADTNPRSRQELLDQRRRKEEARRQVKKEQRRKEKDEETRKADEEIERRFSPGGSGSLLGSPRSPPLKSDSQNGGGNTFSFGRIEFADGTSADTTNLTGNTLDKHKKKGPQDANTALQAAKNKATRLSGLDETKRKQIEEKDMWLNAKRRAHGERVKDDSSLLKKALKRQEGQKRKSEKEWTDRKEGVQKSQEMKQKKRTENLNKRKDEKKHSSSGGKKKSVSKKVKRPGFEGSFKGRSGGGKKK